MFQTIYNEKEKLWTGLRTVPFYNENLSVGQAIIHSLESNPNKIGQVGLIVYHVIWDDLERALQKKVGKLFMSTHNVNE